MSIENAEIAKIALNSYVTMKISFANTLADLCERIPGGDVDVVSDAIGSDSRIATGLPSGAVFFLGFTSSNAGYPELSGDHMAPTR